MDNYFIFDGKRSYSMGIELAGPPSVSGALKNVSSYRIPGRSGMLHEWDETFAERNIRIPCFLLSHLSQKEIREANAWLLCGVKRLILSDDEEHFYLARATTGIDEQTRRGILNPFAIDFTAKPQKFLVSGEREIASGNRIVNPTAQTARPILKIKGSGNATVTVNGTNVICTDLVGTQTLLLDAETGRTMTSGFLSANDKLYFEDEIALYPGVNSVTVSGDAVVSLIPRWFEI